MAWYRDLDRCTYFGLDDAINLRAIGWLERGHPYITVPSSSAGYSDKQLIDEETLAILFAMATQPWQPIHYLGWHDCSLCEQADGPHTFGLGTSRVNIATSNLFVPDVDRVFVAPSMILHYMADHGYQPPEEFVVAVKRCPPMGSPCYRQAILEAGGRGLAGASHA